MHGNRGFRHSLGSRERDAISVIFTRRRDDKKQACCNSLSGLFLALQIGIDMMASCKMLLASRVITSDLSVLITLACVLTRFDGIRHSWKPSVKRPSVLFTALYEKNFSLMRKHREVVNSDLLIIYASMNMGSVAETSDNTLTNMCKLSVNNAHLTPVIADLRNIISIK